MSSRPAPKSANACVLALTAAGLLSLWAAAGGFAATLPTPPQVFIDTTYSAPAGNTITVNAGDNFQAALNNAQLGDTIVLQAGATFAGPFTLPKTSGGGTTIKTVANSHHYRFVGVEFKPLTGNFVYNLISIGNGETSAALLPNNIVFDRCYIHGDPSAGGRRGVAMDGISVAVIDSYLSDFKEVGADTQALWAYNTPGPLKIVNNYLEAAGENVMFGGADSKIADCVPSDIEIKSNLVFKPSSWINSSWTVKNLLELKNARRVLIEANHFLNVWAAGQGGAAIVLTPRNQENTAPWSTVEDVAIILNNFNEVGQGIGISGSDDTHTSQRMNRVLIQNNVFHVKQYNGSNGRLFQVLNGPLNLTFDHNTAFNKNSFCFLENNPKGDYFNFTNNLITYADYGLGSSVGEGTIALNAHFTNWVFSNNAIIGPYRDVGVDTVKSKYPPNNFFPKSVTDVGFENYDAGDFRLSVTSPYKNSGTDGKDVGADRGSISKGISSPQNFRIIQPR